jgi:hypothetical protein
MIKRTIYYIGQEDGTTLEAYAENGLVFLKHEWANGEENVEIEITKRGLRELLVALDELENVLISNE